MRLSLVCGGLLILFSGARADSCTDVVSIGDKSACFDAALRCKSIQSNSERLACFDGVYADGPVTSDAADSDSSAPSELSASPREFSDRHAAKTGSNRIEATIVSITTNAHDIDFLALDNGHIWRENEDSRVRFSAGRKVTIEEGMFGSFNLTMEGAPRAVKVKRVE